MDDDDSDGDDGDDGGDDDGERGIDAQYIFDEDNN